MTLNTITTEATGRRTATPELATIEVKAIDGADTAAAAHQAAKDLAERIRSSLTTVDPNRVQTTEIRVKDRSEMFDPDTDRRYQGLERLHIECLPETAEDIVVDVLEAGCTVQSVDFRFHEEVHQRLQDEALEAAMARAREKAERLAGAERMTVGGIHEVTTADDRSGMEGLVEDALCEHEESDLTSTPTTITQRVRVVYELVAD